MARSRAADNLITAFSHPEVEPVARTALLNALHDSDPGVRMAVASAFQFWNTRLDLVVPALIEALSDPNPSVRGNAASSLGNFGRAAEAAAPSMVTLLRDTNAYVSGTVGDRAAQMLLKIDPEAAANAGVK
jgi:HEAT repeat protein